MVRKPSTITLGLLLLSAATSASGVMSVQPGNRTKGFSSPTTIALEADTFWIEDRTRGPAAYGYKLAEDVRDGPNLYAYVRQNPWSKFDPLGLRDQDPMGDLCDLPDSWRAPMLRAQSAALAGAAVGTSVTMATAGAAAPYVAGTVGTFAVAGGSGAIGGAAGQMTSNTIMGEDVMQGVPTAMALGAGLNVAGTAVAHGLNKLSLPSRNANVAQMADNIVDARAATGASGKATLAQGANADGTTPVMASSVAPPGMTKTPVELHAEMKVNGALGGQSAKDIVVDRMPCPGHCDPFLRKNLPGGSRVFTFGAVDDAGNVVGTTGAKNNAVKAAEGRGNVVPVEVISKPVDPVVAPTLPSDPSSSGSTGNSGSEADEPSSKDEL
ncbi:MAG: hypothetical protein JNJ83_19040 [Verrucomicrobiaceae bacterium]|nr:hypothetical protein [Verrucomicrobiaceae bacterium]